MPMPNPHIAKPAQFPIPEVNGETGRVWNFHLGCGEDSRFSITVQQDGWSITWPDMRRRIVECDDLNELPEGIAAWMVHLTGGMMPDDVAAEAALHIGRWLATNREFLEHERRVHRRGE
jgi:hypothetical protein